MFVQYLASPLLSQFDEASSRLQFLGERGLKFFRL